MHDSIKRILSYSPKKLIQKAFNKYYFKFLNNKKREQIYQFSTYENSNNIQINNNYFDFLVNYINNDLKNSSEYNLLNLSKFSKLIIEKNFDLLGSGICSLKRCGVGYKGIDNVKFQTSPQINDSEEWINIYINRANREYALKCARLIDKDYEFIDWQIDFRSGYRWDSAKWQKDLAFGRIRGADIKAPWELGRMQYLSQLALAYSLADTKPEIFLNKVKYKNEFRNQILDFISSNPPSFGAQWKCAMDVAIRASNWIVAYEMFKSFGAEFDLEFEQILLNSLYSHGEFIVNNLEWSGGDRANHYLANIAGLIFISSYLHSPQSDKWLGFAIKELICEIDRQFYNDGANFEASTSYHALSLEISLYSLLIISKIEKDRLHRALKNDDSELQKKKSRSEKSKGLSDKEFNQIIECNDIFGTDIFKPLKNKLIKSSIFLRELIKKNGDIFIFGDNDSGAFLKLFWNVDIDDHSINEKINDKSHLIRLAEHVLNISLDSMPSNYSYADFGLFFFKNDNYELAFRAGSIGKGGSGGHSHNDQLSIELSSQGFDFFVDAGTFNYTALIDERNKYRSTKSHNTLYLNGIEQNEFLESSFHDIFRYLKERTKATAELDGKSIIAEHFGYPKPHKRELFFENNAIIGKDYLDINQEKTLNFYLHPDVMLEEEADGALILRNGKVKLKLSAVNEKFYLKKYDYSPHYGVKIQSNFVYLNTEKTIINWQINFL